MKKTRVLISISVVLLVISLAITAWAAVPKTAAPFATNASAWSALVS